MNVNSITSKQFNWIGQTVVWPAKDDAWNLKRVELFEFYAQWCQAISLQLFHRIRITGTESIDFIQYGSIGLLEAIDRYNANLGTPFKTYAFKRIRGAIINSVFKFSEHSQIQAWKRQRTQERLSLMAMEQSQGDSEASAGDMLVETILDLAVGILFEEDATEDEHLLQGNLYDSHEMNAMQKAIVNEFKQLPAREGRVMAMHYLEFYKFKEIAEEMGISLSRVSQLHSCAMKTIQQRILAI